MGPAGVLASLGIVIAVVPLPLQRHPLTLQGDLFLEAFPLFVSLLGPPLDSQSNLSAPRCSHDDLRRARCQF